MKNMATKTRRHKEKIVRYRTPVDRFRTKNSKETFKHLVFVSCTHEHLYHLVGVTGEKC
jgi:hypothetical protein